MTNVGKRNSKPEAPSLPPRRGATGRAGGLIPLGPPYTNALPAFLLYSLCLAKEKPSRRVTDAPVKGPSSKHISCLEG